MCNIDVGAGVAVCSSACPLLDCNDIGATMCNYDESGYHVCESVDDYCDGLGGDWGEFIPCPPDTTCVPDTGVCE